jgi:hypothetical protein
LGMGFASTMMHASIGLAVTSLSFLALWYASTTVSV